jgi:hypothetical protein
MAFLFIRFSPSVVDGNDAVIRPAIAHLQPFSPTCLPEWYHILGAFTIDLFVILYGMILFFVGLCVFCVPIHG